MLLCPFLFYKYFYRKKKRKPYKKIGIAIFLLKGRQSRLLLVQPALVAVLLVTLVFLVSYFGGCL